MKKKVLAIALAVGVISSAYTALGEYYNNSPIMTVSAADTNAGYVGRYEMPVTLLKADNPEENSMGNAALSQKAILVVNEDKTACVELSFKSMEYLGQRGYLGYISKVTNNGLIPATVIEEYTDVYDSFNNEDSDDYDMNLDNKSITWYPKTVSIPVDVNFDSEGRVIGVKESDITVQVYVPVMESIGLKANPPQPGGGTQNAILHFQDAAFAGSSASIGGDISMESYFNFSDSFIRDDNAKIVITSEDGRSQTTNIKEIVNNKTENGYCLSTAIPAKDMTSTMTGQIIDGDNNVVDEFSFSFKTYAEMITKDGTGTYSSEDKTFVRELLNYGSFAQVYFDYNTSTLANSGLASKFRTTITKVSAADLSSYNYSENGAVDGLSYSGSSLSLSSLTGINHYFTLDSGKKISDYTFKVNGKVVTPVEENGMYCVSVKGISAKNLTADYTVSVTGNNQTYTLKYSAMDYSNLALNKSDNNALKNLSKSIVLLWKAADAIK